MKNMPRNYDPVGGPVKTVVAFVIWGIAEKDAQGGARGKFMRGCGGKVRIAPATKHTKVIVSRR